VGFFVATEVRTGVVVMCVKASSRIFHRIHSPNLDKTMSRLEQLCCRKIPKLIRHYDLLICNALHSTMTIQYIVLQARVYPQNLEFEGSDHLFYSP